MNKRLSLAGIITLSVGLGAIVSQAAASEEKAETKGRVKLPEAVAKTFQAEFLKAQVTKLDVEKENGVTVYDIEFTEAGIEKETDITADGTMLEFTVVVDAKAVPKAALQTIWKAARGAKIGRIEHIELSCETRDGKVIKLPKPATRYAAEMAKGDQRAEVVVTSDGTVVEPAEWSDEKDESKHETKAGKDEKGDEVLDKAPKAVQATVKELVGQGKIVEFAVEKDGTYELDYQVSVAKSAIIAPDGQIREREESVEVSALPKAVTAAVKKLHPAGKMERAETSTTDDCTVYELKVVVGQVGQGGG